MNRKAAVSLSMIGLLAANIAFAAPGFSTDAPQSSVDKCVAEVSSNANYADAASVMHNIETEDRRVSGHKMSIKTIVFGANDRVIREYASACAINDQEEIKRFKIRQKGR